MTERDGQSWLLEQLRDRDVPCPKCQYNLRGSAKEQCPECGQAFDRRVLNIPLRLGPWFLIGLFFNCAAALAIVGNIFFYPESWGSWGLAVLSMVFTACFVLFAFARQYRHSPDEFAAELAWAIWIPLFLKVTCLTGILIVGH